MRKPHDNAYKYLFSNKRIFLQLLHSFVHEEFILSITEDDLELADKSFVSQEMLDRESDLLYRVTLNGKESYIYILIEFQSRPDKSIPVRMFQYILLLYDKLMKESTEGLLPNVFPILLYNGSEKWTVPTNIRDLIDKYIPDRFIPSYEYFPIIQNEVPQEKLDSLSNLVAAVIRLENAGDKNMLRVAVLDVIEYISEENIVDCGMFCTWLNAMFRNVFSEDDITKIRDVTEVRPMLSEVVAEIERESHAEGKLEGIAEGEHSKSLQTARVMLSKGYQVSEICDLTGLSIEEVEKLQD